MDEETKQRGWEDALLRFKVSNDKSVIADFLRVLHDNEAYEIPDLWFLADLLDGKYALNKGRPTKHKISAGIKKAIAANTVATIISQSGTTLELAVTAASDMLPLSESYIKKSYVNSLTHKNKNSNSTKE